MPEKKISSFLLILSLLLFLLVAACKKNQPNNQITTASLAGTYKLVALTWASGGITANVYDSIDACEKDNLIKFNTDLTANNIDAGIQCSPPENSDGVWHLSGDSLYFDDNPTKIKSFDGKTLVIVGYPTANGIPDPSILATTTLMKE